MKLDVAEDLHNGNLLRSSIEPSLLYRNFTPETLSVVLVTWGTLYRQFVGTYASSGVAPA